MAWRKLAGALALVVALAAGTACAPSANACLKAQLAGVHVKGCPG